MTPDHVFTDRMTNEPHLLRVVLARGPELNGADGVINGQVVQLKYGGDSGLMTLDWGTDHPDSLPYPSPIWMLGRIDQQPSNALVASCLPRLLEGHTDGWYSPAQVQVVGQALAKRIGCDIDSLLKFYE
ncbi:MAG: hypothetical protein ABJN62_18680 [Halioglobus sp.]